MTKKFFGSLVAVYGIVLFLHGCAYSLAECRQKCAKDHGMELNSIGHVKGGVFLFPTLGGTIGGSICTCKIPADVLPYESTPKEWFVLKEWLGHDDKKCPTFASEKECVSYIRSKGYNYHYCVRYSRDNFVYPNCAKENGGENPKDKEGK